LRRWKRVIEGMERLESFEKRLDEVVETNDIELPLPTMRKEKTGGSSGTLNVRPEPTKLPPQLATPLAPHPANKIEKTVASIPAPLNEDDDLVPADIPGFESRSARVNAPESGQSHLILKIVGLAISGLFGLLLGYYILAWVAPDGNFLHLPLPGLPVKATPTTDAPVK
jgi:hypothetical protein